ncbi:DUF2846 domain-containing protein [Sneathiella marina]|uniref:DUF2846 domain-containing protein n=1 Tax=Sneathiella marina TaxID=2950108 RepID=A0ABY4WD85_9PROT|nr:DUF2846 domain-containing protein [Sneathiella marina]USG63229.1 DUF2846 domain-containing protein [Sneathiella marina]
MRIVFVCLAFALLVGCTASGPLFTEKGQQVTPIAGESRVFVYRVDTIIGSGGSVKFLDDGVDKGSINVGGYITYTAKPGYHALLTETPGIDKLFHLEMAAGEVYYLRIDYNPGTWTGTFTTNVIPETTALPQLKLTRYQGK